MPRLFTVLAIWIVTITGCCQPSPQRRAPSTTARVSRTDLYQGRDFSQFVHIGVIPGNLLKAKYVTALLESKGIPNVVEGSVVYGVSVPPEMKERAVQVLEADGGRSSGFQANRDAPPVIQPATTQSTQRLQLKFLHVVNCPDHSVLTIALTNAGESPVRVSAFSFVCCLQHLKITDSQGQTWSMSSPTGAFDPAPPEVDYSIRLNAGVTSELREATFPGVKLVLRGRETEGAALKSGMTYRYSLDFQTGIADPGLSRMQEVPIRAEGDAMVETAQ